jgi:hypothetical protein
MDVDGLIAAISDVTGISIEETDRARLARNVQRSVERAQAWVIAPESWPDYVIPAPEGEDG